MWYNRSDLFHREASSFIAKVKDTLKSLMAYEEGVFNFKLLVGFESMEINL